MNLNSNLSVTLPTLFIGHGSPMNIIENNPFSKAMNQLGQTIKPKGILSISAHWFNQKTLIQNSYPNYQKQIYDFYGFRDDLYQVEYKAKGFDDDLIDAVESIKIDGLQLIENYGIDHGTWAVLHHLYPNADIPVVQMSIENNLNYPNYFKLGQKLSHLKNQGILVLASGNIVHNLRKIEWNKDAKPQSFAVEFDQLVKELIESNQIDKILTIKENHPKLLKLAHPNDDHFIPLLYALGCAESENSKVSYPCSFIQNSSISMRSILFH